jgi:diguanylate cyclase
MHADMRIPPKTVQGSTPGGIGASDRPGLRGLFMWTISAVVMVVLGWVALDTFLNRVRQDVEKAALKDATQLAHTYAGHIYRSFESVNQIALYTKTGWESSEGRLRLEEVNREGVFPADTGIFLSILNEDGELVTSTIDSPRRVNVSAQPFFQVHVNSRSDFYIGQVINGPFSGLPIIPFSRRLTDAAGRFKGIVLVSVQPAYFISGYDETSLGPQGMLAIVDPQGKPKLVRFGGSVQVPESITLDWRPSFMTSSGSTLFNGETWFRDKRNRYVGWDTTKKYGMIAIAGLDQQSVMATYAQRRRQTITTAITITIIAAIIWAIISTLVIRLFRRRLQFEQMQATYRIATEAANEGFYTAKPIFNDARTVEDFQLVDCNERGAAFLRQRREEVLGKTVREIYHGETRSTIERVFGLAMLNHHYEGEIDLSTLGHEGPRWALLRIHRLEDHLEVHMRDISETKAHITALERLGSQDALTDLPNRHWLTRFLPSAITHAVDRHQQLALLYIDLDGFKAVNDTAGHDAGDEALKHAAERLREAVRPRDHVVRLGGDEFVVILEAIHEPGDAAQVAERILDAFRPIFKLSQGMHSIGTSIGIAIAPADGNNIDILLSNADRAMYAVKRGGKRSYRFYHDTRSDDPGSDLDAAELQEEGLRYAIEHDQFVMYYQPRVSLATRLPSGLEALVRWAHPTRGIIDANKFIPVAVKAQLIARLGRLILKKVVSQLAYWKEHQHQLLPVSINMCMTQLLDEELIGVLASELALSGVDANLIAIEVTESMVVMDRAAVSQAITTLRSMGIRILIDHFGIGSESLAQIRTLECDAIKLDPSFVSELNGSSENNAFCQSIISLAHSLGHRIVAEGVETAEQARALSEMQCDEIQGFWVARPQPMSGELTSLPHVHLG